jgi:hypothetical protein
MEPLIIGLPIDQYSYFLTKFNIAGPTRHYGIDHLKDAE